MLALTRKPNESILLYVGDEKIQVKIVSVNGMQVRIGIKASKKVKILRDELIRDEIKK